MTRWSLDLLFGISKFVAYRSDSFGCNIRILVTYLVACILPGVFLQRLCISCTVIERLRSILRLMKEVVVEYPHPRLLDRQKV